MEAWREAVPLSLRNWGLVVEMLHCLQVAPSPKKAFQALRPWLLEKPTDALFLQLLAPFLHPVGRTIGGSLLASTFFRPSLVCPSIFSCTPIPLHPVVMGGGDCEALLVRLPPVPGAESEGTGLALYRGSPGAGPDFVMQGHDSHRLHKTVSTLDNPTPGL